MSAHAQAHLPAFLIQELAHRFASDLLQRPIRFEAVALFADLSGFTALSEALARSGKAGAEELTEILNWHFGTLLELVHAHGGDVVRFGGDAISAVFRCTARNRTQAARRAVQCALAMQAASQRRKSIRTSAGTHRLHMKVGMAHGQVVCTVVGGRDARLEYVVTGNALRRSVAAEQAARSGETVVDDDLAAMIRDIADLKARRGFHVVAQIAAPPRAARRLHGAQPRLSPDAVKAIAQFLHPSVARLLDGSLGNLTNEHRKVTVVFARLEGLSDATLAEHLGELMRVVDDVEGQLARLDVDDAGVRLLITFGAPIAHEDDEIRALQAALKIKLLSHSHCAARIGVNTGFAFCANAGNNVRREYTVMGDAVNTAARLMQAAQPGQIVVGEETRRTVGARFAWTELGPIVVKGKADPVSAAALEGMSVLPASMAVRASDTPLIGRERELTQATAALAHALHGNGQVILISAEAGMGKSRFAAEVARSAAAQGFEMHSGVCDAYATQASYAVWHAIWRGLFRIDASLPTVEQADHLQATLKTIGPDLAGRFSLLGPALNVPLPEKEWIAALDPQQRADALKFMLLDCLRHWARARPLLLILEDCHWLDPPSQALFQFLANNIGDMRVVMASLYRQTGDEYEQTAPLPANTLATRIHLVALDATQSAKIVRQTWQSHCGGSDDRALPSQVVGAIAEKAQGNPLYVESLVQFVCERGLDLSDARAQALDLPDNLRSLILSRIDRLHLDEQAMLKIASVFGREFDTDWLQSCLPSASLTMAMPQHLAHLCRFNLIQPVAADESKYTFQHGLIQETAYDSLAFANRSLLHERAGAFIEQTYADHIAQHVDALAFHFGRTPNAAKQRVYFRKAGDAAKATFANAAAMDYYRRLLPLLPGREQIEVLLSLGGVAQLIGEWDEAERRFQQALALANDVGDAHAKAGCWRALGELYSRRTSYGEAAVWLEQARQAYEGLGDDMGLSRTLERLTYAYLEQGDKERANQLALKHMQIALLADDAIGISDALHNLGLVLAQQGDLAAAQVHLDRAIDIASRVNYKLRVIHANNDVAKLHWQRGDYLGAILSLEQAMRAAREMSYRSAHGVIAGNLGLLYCEVGAFDKALTLFAQALDIALLVSDQPSILTCLGNIAVALYEQGRHNLVERILVRAIGMGRELNLPYQQCEHLHLMADLLARQRRYDDAALLNHEALKLAERVNDDEVLLKARLLEARLRVLTGQSPAPAVSAELSRMLDGLNDDALAAVAYTIQQIDSTREGMRYVAGDAYKRLHGAMPRHEYRARYAELTGSALAPPPALPPSPSVDRDNSNDLNGLLARAGIDMAGIARAG